MKTLKLLSVMALVFTLSAFTTKTEDKGYQIGDIATDFSLQNIDGNKVSLADFKDAKGFIVIFVHLKP